MKNSWVDIKLGARMLVKFPGLTLIGGLAMAVAIAVSTGFFVFLYSFIYPTLPLDEGDRIVGIVNWDTAANTRERRSLHDFVTWRDEARSFDEIGAFRAIERNLITDDGSTVTVSGVEITAAGLRLAHVPPLLGRLLLDEDERRGSAEVAVIDYETWRTQFSSDPSVVGRTVRLGRAVHTVVGVMPEGFGFPMDQRLWLPLRADPADYDRRQGPVIQVVGRIAAGVSQDTAQAELVAIGLRTAAQLPQTNAQLRPRVIPFTGLFFNEGEGDLAWQVHFLQILMSLLLVVVSVNIASLVYARTATRRTEIAVRTALGASRRRVVTQLFTEALVLSTAAAAAGLALTAVGLNYVDALLRRVGVPTPFWVDLGISSTTVLYVTALTIFSAAIVGVLPALQATGRQVQSGLRELATNATGMRLGRTWTALIVAQVALAVAILPTALFISGNLIGSALADPGFAADEFLAADVQLDEEVPPSAAADAYRREFAARYEARVAEMMQRLRAEPDVSQVTFTSRLPGEEATVWIEVDGIPPPVDVESDFAVRRGSGAGYEVGMARVDAGFLPALGVPLLAGRMLEPADADPASTAVVANRAFVRYVFGDGSPFGRRFRYIGASGDAPEDLELGRSYEIVGIVGDLPEESVEALEEARAKVYHAVTPGQAYPVVLAVHVRGLGTAAVSNRLRTIAAALDPTLRLERVLSIEEIYQQEQGAARMAALAIVIVMVSVLLLSSAGLYALMSFAVIQRRREIGIRVAIGANPRRILGSIFSRALRQLAAGIAIGVVASIGLDNLMGGDLLAGRGTFLLPAVSALMLVVGLLAAVGPARRGLRIQATEALKSEG